MGELDYEHCNYGVCGRRTDLDRPFITCIFFLLLSCPGSRHQTGLSGHRLQRAHNGDVFISSWTLAQGQGLEPVRAWIGTSLIELGLIVLTDATRDSRRFSHVEEVTLVSVGRGSPRRAKSGSLLLFFSSGDQNQSLFHGCLLTHLQLVPVMSKGLDGSTALCATYHVRPHPR